MNFIFDPSLVLYLPLYQLDGASFVSKDAHGHLCSVTGALWRPDGRYFDGTDDKIVANTVATNGVFGGAFTVISWAKIGVGGTDGAVIGVDINGVMATYVAMGVGVWADNKFRARVQQSGVNNNMVASASTYTGDTDWHFLAMMVDANGKINHFIVDTTDEGSDTTFALDLSGLAQFDIGNSEQASFDFWSGDIGEILVYRGEKGLIEVENIRRATKWRYR